MSRFRVTAIGWWFLVIVPALLVLLAVWPGLGVYGQGFLPEILAPGSMLQGDFELARLVRLWLGVTLGLACVIGLIFRHLVKRAWRLRLRSFDASTLLGYRRLVWSVRPIACLLCGAALGLGFMVLAPPMRGLSAAAWVVTVALCAVAALLQYITAVFGLIETRRLHAGR
jgi:hypothetical protein